LAQLGVILGFQIRKRAFYENAIFRSVDPAVVGEQSAGETVRTPAAALKSEEGQVRPSADF
jgi:hypothetical protein